MVPRFDYLGLGEVWGLILVRWVTGWVKEFRILGSADMCRDIAWSVGVNGYFDVFV